MSNIVSKTLIRDSEGWFILMDVEGDSNLRYRRAPPASSVIATIVSRSYQKLTLFQLLGWRDGHNKVIESEDESRSGSKNDDSDTESQRSMFQVTDMDNPVDIQKLSIEEAPTQNLEQIDSISTPVEAKPGASNSLEGCSFVEETPPLGTETDNVFMKTTKAIEDQSVKATVPPSSVESTIINERVKFQVDAVMLPEESSNFSSNAVEVRGVIIEASALSTSPPKPTIGVNEKTLPTFSSTSNTNPIANSQWRAEETPSFVGLLDQFGEFAMTKFPLSQTLFKVGALIYPLFLARVLSKFWTMFQSQALAVGLGNLSLSIALSLLIRFGALGQLKLQVDEVGLITAVLIAALMLDSIRDSRFRKLS
ncbi:hypothetical protein FB446DRAFT_709487 [Lentinula raphanica]|nr:hypothetical protein FB446DRAFT_709487 [Lentinula raphanica]